MQKETLLALLLFIPLKSLFAQNLSKDTSISFPIILVENETVPTDVFNSVFYGDNVEKMFVLIGPDTIKVNYDFPIMTLNKKYYLELRSHVSDSTKNYLCLGFTNKIKQVLIKIPLSLFFTDTRLLISHAKLRSKIYECCYTGSFSDLKMPAVTYVQAFDILPQIHKK